jgi:LysM repeat protein
MKSMDVLRHPRFFAASLALLLALGCAPGPDSPLATRPAKSPQGESVEGLPGPNLVPYLTATPAVIPSPTILATDIPIPTPTASTYTVARNDTLSGIAERFGIRLDDLLAANPGVVPEALSVGQTLKIPISSPGTSGGSAATPVPVEMGTPQCYPSGSGQYCFVMVHNPFPDALENIKLQISLVDSDGKSLASQEAFTPLNILPPGSTLPAYAFFPVAPMDFHPVAQLVNSIRLTPGDARYLPAVVRSLLVSVDWNGRAAQVQGQVFLPAESKPAKTLWLAAIAYSVDGQIVGFRRWEWQGSLQPGNLQPFVFSVYSLGSNIEKVDVVVEARP